MMMRLPTQQSPSKIKNPILMKRDHKNPGRFISKTQNIDAELHVVNIDDGAVRSVLYSFMLLFFIHRLKMGQNADSVIYSTVANSR